ncbi:MAG: M16 family metallopeptidase [Planctomycetota bacterium]|jgi:zinc protease
MRNRGGALALVAVMGLLAGCQDGPGMKMSGGGGDESRIFDLPYHVRDLGNGLRVIVVKTDYPDIVTMQIPVQTGSRNEVEEGKSGFAHFFEHMMFRGTEKYPAEVYADILKNAGADQNAYTTDDYTNYHTTFTKNDLEKVIEIEADRFKNLSYSEDQFRTEALAVRGEYLKNFSNPSSKLFERIRDIAFKKHTYKHTTMGYFRDIEAMPDQLEYSKVFFDRWYRPEYTTVMICGDVEPADTFRLVEKYWGDWERGSWTVDIPVEPVPEKPVYDHIKWDAPTQPWVVIGFHGPAFDGSDPALPSLEMLNQHYFSFKSELYQRLVIKEQTVDRLYGMFVNRKDPYLLTINARATDPKHVSYVREAILDTLAQARTNPIPVESLDEIKSRMRYGFASRMDNTAAIGSILARYVHFRRDPEIINELYAAYDDVTPEDVLRYANEYITDNSMVTVTLSNESSIDNWNSSTSIETMVAERGTDVEPVGVKLVGNRGDSPLINVSLLFNVGAADDPAGKKGLAAMVASMITDGGSKKRSINEIQDTLFPIASGFSAQVDKEMIRLSGMVHRDNLDTWYGVMKEQLLTPGWRAEDLERIRKRRISDIRTGLVGNNDEELGKELLYASIYGPSHPYGSMNLGDVSDIESITMQDVISFFERYFTPENLTVGLAGGYEPDLVGRLKADVAALPRGSREKLAVSAPSPIEGHQAIIVQKQTPGVAVSFGFPIDVRRGDPDWPALWLVRSWLGEHRSSNSRLFQRIRELRGMNYGDYAYIEYFPRGMYQFHPDANLGRQHQIFQVWIRPLRTNNDAHFATRAAVHEMNKLIRNGLTEEQFEATRNYLNKFASLLTQTQSRQLGYAMDCNYYGTPPFVDYVRESLASLTLDDVNRVLRKHLQTENMKFVFVSKDAEDLKQRLTSNQSSPLTYDTPKADLAEEDAIIQTLPLDFTVNSVSVVPVKDVFE